MYKMNETHQNGEGLHGIGGSVGGLLGTLWLLELWEEEVGTVGDAQSKRQTSKTCAEISLSSGLLSCKSLSPYDWGGSAKCLLEEWMGG